MSKNRSPHRPDHDGSPIRKQHLNFDKIPYIQFARVLRSIIHDNRVYARTTQKVEHFMQDGIRNYLFTVRPYTREIRVTMLRKGETDPGQLTIAVKLHLRFKPKQEELELSGEVLQELRPGSMQAVVIDDYLD